MTNGELDIVIEVLREMGYTREAVQEWFAANPDCVLIDMIKDNDNKAEFDRLLKEKWYAKYYPGMSKKC